MKALLIFCFTSTLLFAADGARYEVPVAKDLEKFAQFELQDFHKEINGDKLVVSYHLPEVLTGKPEFIHLEGRVSAQSSEVLLVGAKGIAKCQAFYDTCQVEYYDLAIDKEAALSAIEKISQSLEETAARLEVMRVFSTDPVGLIKY